MEESAHDEQVTSTQEHPPLYAESAKKLAATPTSWRVRILRPLNMFVAALVVVALCLSALALFLHQSLAGKQLSISNPLPGLVQPPIFRDPSPFGDDASEHSIPTFAFDQATVYATDGRHSIYALQASTGSQVRRVPVNDFVGWSVLADQGVLYTVSSPTSANGVVSGSSSLEAWNASGGSLLWRRTLAVGRGAARIVPPLVSARGVLYLCVSAGGDGYTIYALHVADGTTLWSHNLDVSPILKPLERITVANDVIYVSSPAYPLIALRAKDGSVLWNDGPSGVTALPTVANGIIYVSINTYYYHGPHVDAFAAVSTATGKVLWDYPLEDDGPVGSPVVAGNTVYVGSDENRVYAFAADSGLLKWSSTMGHLHALPRSDNQRVFVGAVSANTVLVGSEDGYVCALEASTGALRWYYQASGLYTSPTVTQGETVYVQSDYPNTATITLAALHLQDGQALWAASLGAEAGPTVAAPSTPGIAPHLSGIPSFTADDVTQYFRAHTLPNLNIDGTPTITFTNYKDAIGMLGETMIDFGGAPSPGEKQLVCIVIWRTTEYSSAYQKNMQHTSAVIFSANTGQILETVGDSARPA